MAKAQASNDDFRDWVEENIRRPKQAPISAYHELGRRANAEKGTWKARAERLGMSDATLR